MSVLEPKENQTATIPDFFYEFIGRIVPGLVVIAICIYWSEGDFKAVFSSVGLSVFVLVAAWVIGVTLDVGVFVIAKCVCPEKPLKKVATDLKTWWFIRKLTPWERGVIGKMLAQMIFFRNMLSICALTALICVAMEFFPTLDFSLPALHDHHRCYGLFCGILSLVFLLCWKAQRNAIRDWERRTEGEHDSAEAESRRLD